MKVWMWQRLVKKRGVDKVFSVLCETKEDKLFCLDLHRFVWLCPKPNLVLVDRKYLGGMK